MSHDRNTLRMVFGYHVVQEVVAADGAIDERERAFLESHWPSQLLVERGLLNAQGERTPLFDAARAQAIDTLKRDLTLEEKLGLIDTFMQASLSDGHLHHQESATVVRAAQLLDVPSSAWLGRMEAQGLAGEVELPEPDGLDSHLILLDPVEEAPTETPADAATESPDDG